MESKNKELTEWQKFFIKISKENPQLKNNRDRKKIATIEWIKSRKPKRVNFN